MNPIEVFFGHPPPLIVIILKDRPDWLLQVVGRAKRFMMAQVHPDRGHSGDLELSSEISGAFSALEDLNRWPEYLEEYLAKPNKTGFLQAQVQTLEKDIERLHRSLRNKQKEIERLQGLLPQEDEVEKWQRTAWQWFVSSAFHRAIPNPDLPESLFPPDSVSRGRLHNFRVVVEQENADYKYAAYEFDITGRVRMTAKSDDLALVRTALIFRSDKKPRRNLVFSRNPGPLLVGSTTTKKEFMLRQAIEEGIVQPYVAIGSYPVFMVADSYGKLASHTTRLLGWEKSILEIIPLKKFRRELTGPGGRNRHRPGLERRLREYKKRSRRE